MKDKNLYSLNERCGAKTFSSAHKTWSRFGLQSYKKGKLLNYNPSDNAVKYKIKNKIRRQRMKNNNYQSFMEDSKIIRLLDFNRKSYESSYNSYYQDNFGNTKSNRIKIKGFKFYDDFNNIIAELEVEYLNDFIYITKFEIDGKYSGMGFAKDLLQVARTSLGANAAKIEKNKESKVNFFLRNGFIKKGEQKQFCILVAENNKINDYPKDVQASVDIRRYEPNNNDYNLGGFDFEGYRGYL